MMKIALDIRMIESSGIGTTIRGLLDHLADDQLNQMELCGPQDYSTQRPHSFFYTSHSIYGLSQHVFYGRQLNQRKPLLYHMPHYDVPLSYSGPLIITVHDLIHIIYPEFSTKPFSYFYARYVLGRAVKKANKIIVVSKNTEKDLVRYFPEAQEKTEIISPSVSSDFKNIQGPSLLHNLASYNLTPGYWLYVGNLRTGKNTKNLVEAHQKLYRQYPHLPELVLVGKNFIPEWNQKKPEGKIRILGNVNLKDLPSLYSGASLFVFPSYYEGFGLPPLEAMACGVPVLSSPQASLKEVCGEGALYLSDLSSDGIAKSLSEILNQKINLHPFIEKGQENIKRFSWKKFADSTWTLYKDVCHRKSL